MKILAVGAHPDDIELGCIGTLLKFKEQGANITAVVLVKPTVEVRSTRSKDIVEAEVTRSQEVSGIPYVFFNTPTHDNGRPNLTVTTNSISEFENLVGYGYDLVITHWHEDYHQDHRAAYQICNSYVRSKPIDVWYMDEPIYNKNYTQFTRNTIVDITAQWPVKQKTLECYDSYFTDQQIAQVRSYAHYHGTGNNLVECFNQTKRYL